jgi:hypothetical protein
VVNLWRKKMEIGFPELFGATLYTTAGAGILMWTTEYIGLLIEESDWFEDLDEDEMTIVDVVHGAFVLFGLIACTAFVGLCTEIGWALNG